jgi:hypothetical protein
MDFPIGSTRSWELFFAEFWSIVDIKVEPSINVPFCCPVRDYFNVYSSKPSSASALKLVSYFTIVVLGEVEKSELSVEIINKTRKMIGKNNLKKI